METEHSIEQDCTDDGTPIPSWAFTAPPPISTANPVGSVSICGCGFGHVFPPVVQWHMERCPHAEVVA